MPVTELRIEGYRSIRDITLPLKRANIITGPNGCGKSNLYQAVGLLRRAAEGTLSKAFADEGGMPSALWAGRRSAGPVRMKIGVSLDEYVYDLEIGLPQADPKLTVFVLDPYIKKETLKLRQGSRLVNLLDRGTSSCRVWKVDGRREDYQIALHHGESALDQIGSPREYPFLDDFRRRVLKWRFYHGFRSDMRSPLRVPQPGVRTFVLSGDGSDLAAALQTIRENGNDQALDQAIEDAFPGAVLGTGAPDGSFEVNLFQPEFERPMRARELSDGTLRYLCLLAALLSPSPAPLIALNEPESSLNEELMEPLARLIANAALTSQVWVTTHSHRLSKALSDLLVVAPIALEKVDGATQRKGRPRGVAFSAEFDA